MKRLAQIGHTAIEALQYAGREKSHGELAGKQAGDAQHDESDLPIAYASFIKQTLSIIMGVGTEPHFNRLFFTAKLSNLIHQMEGGDPHAGFVANELRRMFPEFIQATSGRVDLVRLPPSGQC